MPGTVLRLEDTVLSKTFKVTGPTSFFPPSCISDQVEHLQGLESYLSFSLLTWHLEKNGFILGLESYFNNSLVFGYE